MPLQASSTLFRARMNELWVTTAHRAASASAPARRRRKAVIGAFIGRRKAYLHVCVAGQPKAHGEFLAGDVGELAGVTGNTVGQWARRGLIDSSQSDGEPRVYSVEDINEASVVAELLARG